MPDSFRVDHTAGPVQYVPRITGAAPAPPYDQAPLGVWPSGAGSRFAGWIGHLHRPTRQPDGSGADKYAYQALGLTEYSPIGYGDHNRQQFLPLQPPVLFAAKGLPIQGLGGLAQGQFFTQPLIVPAELQSEELGYPDIADNWIGLP